MCRWQALQTTRIHVEGSRAISRYRRREMRWISRNAKAVYSEQSSQHPSTALFIIRSWRCVRPGYSDESCMVYHEPQRASCSAYHHVLQDRSFRSLQQPLWAGIRNNCRGSGRSPEPEQAGAPSVSHAAWRDHAGSNPRFFADRQVNSARPRYRRFSHTGRPENPQERTAIRSSGIRTGKLCLKCTQSAHDHKVRNFSPDFHSGNGDAPKIHNRRFPVKF